MIFMQTDVLLRRYVITKFMGCNVSDNNDLSKYMLFIGLFLFNLVCSSVLANTHDSITKGILRNIIIGALS